MANGRVRPYNRAWWGATKHGGTARTIPESRPRIVSLSLVALLLAGCASASSPATSEAPDSVAASEAPGSQAAEPSSQACDPGVICSGPLAPGDYTSTSTGATITFTLAGSEWSADADTPGVGFALFYDDPGGPVGITVAPWAGVIFSDACAPEPTETIGTAPADLMGVLTVLDGVQADAPTGVTVGGLPALRVNLTTESPCADSGGKLWVFQTTAGGIFNLRDATKARIYAVDAGNATLVIAIEAIGEADYEGLLEKAEEILAGMTIAPAA